MGGVEDRSLVVTGSREERKGGGASKDELGAVFLQQKRKWLRHLLLPFIKL